MEEKERDALLQRRRMYFQDAISFHPDQKYVPNLSFFVTWKVFDSDLHCKLSEALLDYDLMAKLTHEFEERYGFDTFIEYSNRNQWRITEHAGSSVYKVDDAAWSVQVTDFPTVNDDEMMEFAQNVPKFQWEKCIPRKYPKLAAGVDAEFFTTLQKEFGAFLAYCQRLPKELMDAYGMPICMDYKGPMILCPAEPIFSHYRGIRNFSLDMRRHKSELHAMMDAILPPAAIEGVKAAWKNIDNNHTQTGLFDGDNVYLAHTVMNPRQFEEFYLPYIKVNYDILEEHPGISMRLFTEGSAKILLDVLNDYRKGMLFLHLDVDDPYEIRQLCPKAGIIGGMDTHVLGNGTVEECVAITEKLVKDFSVDGGYVFSENRMVSYPNDAKRENLLAVCNWLRDYNNRI
jgi:hypothetical protein